MKLLLDTHVWLWWTTGSTRIDRQTRKVLDEPSNDVFLSAVSAWEIAIKYRIGRIALPSAPAEYISSQMQRQSIRALDMTIAHAVGTVDLPLHHRDPFDRMLIAQARCEALTLVTADLAIVPYAVAQLHL